jgi:hypothetical protein
MNQKVSTGLGTAILMVMAFTAGYFVWMIEKKNQWPVVLSSTPVTVKIESKKQETEDATIDTASWKQFAHVASNFTFLYPSEMIVGSNNIGYEAEKAPDISVSQYGENPILNIESAPVPGSKESNFNPKKFDPKEVEGWDIKKTAEEIWAMNRDDTNPNIESHSVSILSQTTIAGRPAYQFSVTGSYFDWQEERMLSQGRTNIFTTNLQGKKLKIYYPSDSALTKKILDSMKFIDSAANEMVDSTMIKFDDCGKIDSYSNELWYGDVMSRLGEFKQSERGILDVCQSLDKSLVIILTNGGSTDGLIPYCEAGSLFKYSVANKILSQATFDDRGRGCVAWPSEFGQRSGNMILLQGFGGDAGCGSTMYYEYDFMSDAVILKKECSKCEGEKTEVCKDNFFIM